VNYSTLTGSTVSTNSLALASTLTGSSIILSGNVGIGTTTPAYALDVNGTINCGNFNVSGGITAVYNLTTAGRDTFTTTLQVPGSGFYLLSAFSTLYNGAAWGSSSVWCNAVISPYLSGYATTYPPGTGTVLYSSNMELNIDANGYIVISFPAGDGIDTFRINYLRLS
jgi:hypothetical protein